jgi:hypothetical protein
MSPTDSGRWSTTLAIAAILLVFPTGAFAQAGDSLQRLTDAASRRDVVIVTSRTGVETKGRLMGLTADAIELRRDDQRLSLPLAMVRRVESRDSLKNGTLIGAAAAVLIYIGGLASDGELDDCSAVCVPAAGYVFGIGAGIGAIVDAAVPGRRLLYEAPPGQRSVASVRGIRLITIRW